MGRVEVNNTDGRLVRALLALFALALSAVVTLPAQKASAAAGQLTEVTGFGTNPGNLRMFEWVPADLPANAPLVVMLHGCLSSASSYDTETGLTTIADTYNFALVFPQQKSANDWTSCFSYWNTPDITRGQGEALSVKQMVDWMRTNRGVDPSRVFVMGHSGGGLFASVMLATYPDVFSAGAIVAGGPYKCGTKGGCTDGTAQHTPQEWGDLARSGDPGYGGTKPRVAIWQGTSDTTVSYNNFNELMEQWTNYHATDQTADVSDTVKGFPHKVYKNSAGTAVVETYSLTGKSHGWPIDPGTAPDQCNGSTPSIDDDICAVYFTGKWFGTIP